jgi:hypothetical protein
MYILTKSKQLIKSAVVGGSVFALVAVPTAALAHGNAGNDDNGRQSSRQASSQHDKNRNNDRSNSWWQDKQHRHKTCEERQAALNQKATTYHDRYTKQLTGLNIVYSGLQTYAESGDVTVENYEALKAETNVSQANATTAVNAITAPQLNCEADSNSQSQSDSDNGNANSSLNASIKAAKDALSAYRHDVMQLFNAAINA